MYRKYFSTTLAVLLVVMIASTAGAQYDFGCGELRQDVESSCMFFLDFDGGAFVLDDIGEFSEGDTVHVIGEPGTIANPCDYCGTFQYPCIHDVIITECEMSTGCCQSRVGDANGLGGDEPTIGDISVIIDALFITGTCEGIISCLAEADVNQSGGCSPTCEDITISDITDVIFCTFLWPGDCSHIYVDCLSCPIE